jgi:Putative peptidoglycan binding domain
MISQQLSDKKIIANGTARCASRIGTMKNLVFTAGLTLMLASNASHAQQAQQVPKTTTEPGYLQALNPAERKDYEALKADWEKHQKTDPKGFKKLRSQVTLHSQMVLGRFGYGTLFTGGMDDRTQDALRAYQTKKGLPISGDVDPITYYWLTRDDDAAEKRVTFLPAFSLYFHDDYVSADGAWDHFNESDGYVRSSHLECYKERGLCLEADATQMDILGSPGIVSTLTEYQITKWDAFELIAEDATPDCERDQLLINRQEKSVTILSTPTYKSESCKKLLGKPESVTYRLLDGSELGKARRAAAQKDKSNLYQFSAEAKAIMNAK